MAVENQFVVGADDIHLDQRYALVAGHALEHGEPGRFLAALPGRGGDVHHERRAHADEIVDGVGAITSLGPEIGIVPDVLANRHGDLLAAQIDRRDFLGRLEIAVLIENVVGRQERLHDPVKNFPVLNHRRGVAQRAARAVGIAVDVAGNERNFTNGLRKEIEAFEAALNEIFAQQQVAGRVAAKEKFRGENQLRAFFDRFAISLFQPRAVLVERADGGVELEEGDAHGGTDGITELRN